MAISVLDFYPQHEVRANTRYNFLLEDCLMCVLVVLNDKPRELAFTIPKYYNFKRVYNDKRYKVKKLLEYSILITYIEKNKEAVKKRFGLSDRDFNDFCLSLKNRLILSYSDYKKYQKFLIRGFGYLKKLFNRIFRSKK